MTTPVNPAAFIWALITAPLIVGLPSIALALIVASSGFPSLLALAFLFGVPPVAVVLGAPTYLTFGAVFLWNRVQSGKTRARDLALAGLGAHLASLLAVIPVLIIFDAEHAVERSLWFLGLGAIFAPLWSAIFAKAYDQFSRATPYERP